MDNSIMYMNPSLKNSSSLKKYERIRSSKTISTFIYCLEVWKTNSKDNNEHCVKNTVKILYKLFFSEQFKHYFLIGHAIHIM